MKLNEKQREACLEFALGRYLKKWQGSPESAYRRLKDYFALVREGIELLDKSVMEVRELGVTPRGCYASLFAFDLVRDLLAAFDDNMQLAEKMLELSS